MRKYIDYFLIIIMYLIITAVNIYYFTENKLYLSWDQSAYLNLSGQIGYDFRTLNLNGLFNKIFIFHSPWSNRPSMFMLTGGIFAALTNFNILLTTLFNNMFWMLILATFTYKLSELVYNKTGLLSVFMVLTSNVFIYTYRDYLCDLPLTCGVIIAAYGILNADNFGNKKLNLIAIVYLIFGAMIKETFIIYTFPIFIYSTIRLIKSKTYRVKPLLKNYCLVYFGAALIILFLYYPYIHYIISNALANIGDDVGKFYSSGRNDKFSLHYYIYYLELIKYLTPQLYIIIPFIGLCINSLLNFSIPKIINFKINYLLWMIIFPIVILTLFVTDTDYRFIMPVVPLILIISSSLIIFLSSKIIKILTIFLIILIGSINFISSFYNIKLLNHELSLKLTQPTDTFILNIFSKRMKQDWKVNELIQYLCNIEPQPKKIGVSIGRAYINPNTIQAYSLFLCPKLSFEGLYGSGRFNVLNNSDYILTTKNKPAESPQLDFNQELFMMNKQILNEIKIGNYKIVKEIELPESTQLIIVKKPLDKE